MELVATELICLIITIATLVAMVRQLFSNDGIDNTSLVCSFAVFITYLVSSLVIHLQTEGVLTHPPALLRSFFFLHILAVPIFIFVWLSGMERRILRASTKTIIMGSQVAMLVLFVALTTIDIWTERLFVFNRAGILVGGSGVKIMLALSAVMLLVALAILIAYRVLFTGFSFTGLSLASAMLVISLIFFALFKHPYLFGVTGTFILLFSFLAWQRRELTLDSLTKIPNYTAYLSRLRQITSQQRQKTIIMVDIENFRLINDRYSNESGDRTLAAFATSIATLSPRTVAYRLYRNSFAIIGPRLSHLELVRVINRIRTFAVVGWLINGEHISVHLQFAIVETPVGANTAEEVAESLEFTMAEIKERRRVSVIIFNQRLVPIRKRRLEVLSALRTAVTNESGVVICYQPIINSDDNRIVAAEALMRIDDPHLGMISPAEFIPVAEQAGLIRELTAIVVRKVCALLAANLDLASNLSHISINISASDIASPEMGSRLLSIIREAGIEPSKIVFEVTESKLLGPNGQILKNWKLFTDYGVHFMLDDFGTGYSNIESLVTLPFEIVKLDRSVIANDVNDYQLIALISTMLRRLGKQMVAEGVETRAQLEIATRHGIGFIQGYYFSKPVDEAQLIEWMAGSMCIVPKNQH
ncbi:MAG: EAL domain-containing protein [Sphaerochaeta sp.]|nr:EAL domain-containing protein [Sphaerochaeta sp.]